MENIAVLIGITLQTIAVVYILYKVNQETLTRRLKWIDYIYKKKKY